MDWSTFNWIALHRLLIRARRHEIFYRDAIAFLKRHGHKPVSPLVRELEQAHRQLVVIVEVIEAVAKDFEPYRPLMDPWKTQGLAAQMRPDFRDRRIEQPAPKRPRAEDIEEQPEDAPL